jgi:hypothetical protein
MKFVEVETDKFIHSDQIVSVELQVAETNIQGTPFKYQVVTTLIDERTIISPMGHRNEVEPLFNNIINQLNSP